MRVHRQTKARPIDRHAEERPHLIPLPARPFDAAEVVYRTVDAEGFVVYRQNFYATPWRLIGQSVAVRVTEDELVIHDKAFVEAARHRLFPRTVAGQRSPCKDHEPPRDAQRRSEQLAERFAEFGATGTRFLEGLLAGSRFGKNQAERVLSLAAVYPRADVLAALERAVRYGAFSLQAVGRILAARGRPKAPLDALADDHRTYLDRLLDGDADTAATHLRLPSPAGREAPRCRTHRPRHAERITRRKTGRPGRTTASGLHGDVSQGPADAGRRGERPEALDAVLSAAEKDSLSHLEFLHRLLAGPAEARLQRALERRITRREVPRTDDPGRVRLGVQRQGSGPAGHRATGHLRLRAAARERHPGGSIRPGQKPDPPGRGPRRVRAGIPRPVRDQRQAAPGVHRGSGRRDLDPSHRRIRTISICS